MEKVFVAQRLANKLWATEAKIDEAMREAAELMAELMQAPKAMDVSMVVADPAQAKLMESIKGLSEARTAMVAAHGELFKAQAKAGVRVKALFTADSNLHHETEVTAKTDLRDVG